MNLQSGRATSLNTMDYQTATRIGDPGQEVSDKPLPHSDTEQQQPIVDSADDAIPQQSAYKSLGWLDRLLALWVLLAVAIGILLGNFVDSVGPALQKGKFVHVSIPIGRVTHANATSPSDPAQH